MATSKRTLRTVLLITGLLLLGLVAACAWLFYGHNIRDRLSREPFDPAAWRSATTLADPARIRMVDDLLRRHDLQGMTRDEVAALIGEPDETNYFRDWDMVYWLGPERGFMSIDSEWLVLRLDEEMQITEVRIARD